MQGLRIVSIATPIVLALAGCGTAASPASSDTEAAIDIAPVAPEAEFVAVCTTIKSPTCMPVGYNGGPEEWCANWCDDRGPNCSLSTFGPAGNPCTVGKNVRGGAWVFCSCADTTPKRAASAESEW